VQRVLHTVPVDYSMENTIFIRRPIVGWILHHMCAKNYIEITLTAKLACFVRFKRRVLCVKSAKHYSLTYFVISMTNKRPY
jgi:hypothetical protein